MYPTDLSKGILANIARNHLLEAQIQTMDCWAQTPQGRAPQAQKK